MSAQPAPVRNTHNTPFNTARSLWCSGRPRPSLRLTALGINGRNISHAPSGNSSAFAIQLACDFRNLLYSAIYEMTSNNN
jgi:hypothetical protein